jgi:hypothetical protein
MSDRVKHLIRSVVPDLVNVVDRGAASDARLSITGDKGMQFPIWVTIETIEVPDNMVVRTVDGVRDTSLEVPEAQLSAAKVRKFWAHTNDFDGEVYGWSAAELFVVNGDRQKVVDAVVEHLERKLSGQERIEVKMLATAARGTAELPTLVGDSDSGPDAVHPQVQFDSI